MSAGPVQSDAELQAILALQQLNLPRNISPAEAAAQGFVTVQHTLPILQRMHALRPSIVARDGDKLAGYAIVMPVECRSFIPVLEPMFARLDAMGFQSKRFYVMGQVCVAKEYRGQGVFDSLYAAHKQYLSGDFDSVVTEIAMRNTRSLRAHERVGFQIIERYRDETDDWAVVEWRWR